MNYLVDSHIVIWLSLTPEKVSAKVRALLADCDARVMVSVASLWEIAIKHAAGRLHFPMDHLNAQLESMVMQVLRLHFPMDHLNAQLESMVMQVLDITTLPHALAAAALPPHHNDPFDRMLIAQARMEALLLVTADAMIPTYEVGTLSARA